MNKLTKYNEKRNFKKTKEPIGKKTPSHKKLHFVVQHHLARKDHYDLRLEWKGTMISFAVPKGPSYNPKDKRLAIHVEDHPLSYRHFEGTIPKGEYGGGTVMVWDEGYWEPLGNPSKDFKNGLVKFILRGKRLRGHWTLVSFKEDNWLLIKEKDNAYVYKDILEYNTSVKTGRTMEEIANHSKRKKNSKKEGMIEGISITNPKKKIYASVTKMDIVNYYQQVAKRMLPYMEKRLISVIRSPEGIKGDIFFKKHLDNDNKGIGKIKIKNEEGNREDYYYIKDVSGLISEVQRNSFEFHIWGSHVHTLNHPDYLVFDLDPDEKLDLKRVREGVLDLKKILDELKLTSFLKTSGGKGYHVVVPTQKLKTWKSFREFAKNIADLMEAKWPEKYTSNVRKENRKHRIFIDWIRNTKGATSVAPYSLRIRKNLRVSMPIRWSELGKVKPNEITIEMALKRLKRKDPWENFFDVN